MKILDLSDCYSDHFPSGKILNIFPNILELNLSYNRIKIVPLNFSTKLKQLKKLDLSFNLFEDINMFVSSKVTDISIYDIHKICH
jgi:hypothetical protein